MQMREVSKEDLPDIYCDMDQVLCNFMKGADAAVGGSFVNTDKEERWKTSIKQKVSGQILSGCQVRKECISSLKSMIHTFCLPSTPVTPHLKLVNLNGWAKNTNFPKSRIHLVKRSQKQQYATTNGKPNILIDDYMKNINEWEKKGGIGVHHTDPRKTINELKRLGFK